MKKKTLSVDDIRREADEGNAEAQNKLGSMYLTGRGVPRNFEDAAMWYLRAAEQGHVNAQFNLGLMYHKGEGVEQNDKETARWFLEAAEQGHVTAQFNLGEMFKEENAGYDAKKTQGSFP
jgi:uncharacterized protein